MDATAAGLPVRPLPDGSDIRKVDESNAGAVVDALTDAFYDDPHMRWCFPDERRRRRRIERGWDLYLHRLWLRHGECYTTDRFVGGALWLPPDRWRVPALTQLRMLPAMVARNGRDLGRLLRVVMLMERKHPHEPHYYLAVLGVRAEFQGRGFGATLMRPVLERCDADGVPAYLEASTSRNRALYERNGFELVEEIRATDDAPPLFLMWREPRR